MNYFLFLDESGDHGLTTVNSDFPVFVLSGVLIEESKYRIFHERLDNLKKEFWNSTQVILHSRDIRKCDKEFSILFDLEIKKRFYERLNNLISDTEFIISAGAIRKDDYIRRYGPLAENPYEVALTFIIDGSVAILYNEKSKRSQAPTVELMIEKRGKREDELLRKYLDRLIARKPFYSSKETGQLLIQKIGFHDKRENINGLQLADLVAYPIARYVLEPLRPNPAFDLIRKKIYSFPDELTGLQVFP